MAFLKILTSTLIAGKKGKPAEPGKPAEKPTKPVRLTVVEFRLTAPAEVHVRMNKGEATATLLEVGPGKERGVALHDELARTPEAAPGPPGGPPGGQGQP